MSEQTNNMNDPILTAEEDVVEPAFTLGDYGRKIFKGDKVVWSVFIQCHQYHRLPPSEYLGAYSSACNVFNRRRGGDFTYP